MLVAGLSARALAQAAQSAGYEVLAADLFGDLDLEAAAQDVRRVDGDVASGFVEETLIEALDDLARDRRPVGLVLGAGFEDRPSLIARLEARWPLLGNDAATVSRAKDPRALADLCAAHAIPHPEVSTERPEREGWIAKRVGGSGGSHVGQVDEAAPPIYWQRRVSGEAVSALVVANGTRARLVGLTEQWTAPTHDARYRYGGAVRPASVEPRTGKVLEGAAVAIAEALGLKGLNSVDFLVGADAWWLLEVNARPGATLDVFRRPPGQLFRLHMEACAGVQTEPWAAFEDAEAAALVYAREAIPSMPLFDWPDWAADRQRPATVVEAGAPICTALVSAETPQEARRLAGERADEIRDRLERLS